MESLRAALTLAHYGWRMANRTFVGNDKTPHNLCNIDYLRDNLIGLDDLQSGSLVANAQTLAFAYIAERGALHGGSFKFYRFENSYRRDGAGCARPFDVVEFCLCMFILPFEGKSCPRSVVACNRTGSCISRIIVANHQSVYRERILLACHLLRKLVYFQLDIFCGRVVNTLTFYRIHSQVFQHLHAFAP